MKGDEAMSKQFNHLNIPSHWQSYWTRFPEGHTILEALIQWVSQVDEMVDNQNNLSDTVSNYGTRLDQFIDQFDGRLSDEVKHTLGEWQQSGFLDDVINDALDTKYHEMDNRLTTQLAQTESRKIDKDGSQQVKWANIAQDAREQISGEKVAIVGTDSVGTENITVNAVTPNKLDRTYADGKLTNYLDRNDIIDDKYWSDTTGNLIDGVQTTFAFPKIKLEIGQTYSLTTLGVFRFVFYDSNDVMTSSGRSDDFISPFVPTEKETYLGVAYNNFVLPNLPMLVEGTDLPNEYIPTMRVPKNLEHNSIKTTHLDDRVITPIKLDRTYVEGILTNYLDRNDIIEDAYHSDITGVFIQPANGTTFAYPKIKLPIGKAFSLDTSNLFRYVFYDSNDVMTSSGRSADFINPFVPTEKETYLGVSYYNSRLTVPPTLVPGERVSEKYIEPFSVPKKLGANTVETDSLSNEVLSLITGGTKNLLVVEKDSGLKTIQSAIDRITDDSPDNVYTVLIMPGTYERFTMKLSPNRARYISLIGMDRENTIILSDTGHYNSPPAEIYTNGTVESLTFEMKATVETFTGSEQQAYALHDDYGSRNTLYKNCLFKSNAGPAFGGGTFADDGLQLHDWDFITTSDGTFGTNALGAVFCHTNGTRINQYVEFVNCRAINEYGVDGFRFRLIDDTGGSYNYYVQNSLSWGVDGARAFSDVGLLDEKSFGNNVTTLNA